MKITLPIHILIALQSHTLKCKLKRHVMKLYGMIDTSHPLSILFFLVENHRSDEPIQMAQVDETINETKKYLITKISGVHGTQNK